MVTVFHISVHTKREEAKGSTRDCFVWWLVLGVDSGNLVKGGVAVLQALPPCKKLSSQIPTHEVSELVKCPLPAMWINF